MQQRVITDHTEIKEWASEHRARPAIIDDPAATGDRRGIRFDFPGEEDEEELPDNVSWDASWDDFFKIFEERKLGLLLLRDPELGSPEDSYKFVYRDENE